jgi:hypothetical protein
MSKSFPAKLACIRWVVLGAPAGGFGQVAQQDPLCPCLPRTSSQGRSALSDPKPRAGIVCTADIRGRELRSGRGIERQNDLDVALVPSRISCPRLSVSARLPVKGSRETESGTIGGGGRAQVAALRTATAALRSRGLSVNVRDLRRMQVRACGTGVW